MINCIEMKLVLTCREILLNFSNSCGYAEQSCRI